MDEDYSVKNNWSILIGINFYVKDKSLEGCVRDVETIERYLRAGFGPDSVDIVTLTIDGPSDIDPQSPKRKLEQLPTHENVIRSLKRVLDSSKQGDLVYFHFSGHGTRIPHTSALALVLFDQEQGSRLLHGQLLASVLERMTEKGLFVTLVLDCCFSGSTLRRDDHGDATVRTTFYDKAIDTAYPLQESDAASFDMTSILEALPWRDGQSLPQWLVSPNYTILTACGPHEVAEELEIKVEQNGTRERRGALSYFLLEALISLRRSGIEVIHSSLHQHLLMKFHTYWPRQTPMRRGNKNLSFFGKLRFDSDLLFVPVFKTGNDRICLDAGYAHDVHEGDEYALYPFNTSESTSSQTKTHGLRFRVDAVGCLTSDLVSIESPSAAHEIDTGWKARLLTPFPTSKVPVRIMSSIRNKAQWVASAEQQSSLNLLTEDEDKEHCLYNVSCTSQHEYEILDASCERIANLPSVPAIQDGATEHVLHVLQHLAKFKRFEGIENRIPDASFEASFAISSNNRVQATGFYDVGHGGEWQFIVENLSKNPLYLTTFDLQPSGQIKNLVSDSDGGYLVVMPKEKLENSMQMEVPEFLQRRSQNECVDIIKFFLTSKPTCFPSEVLPKIPLSARELSKDLRSSYDQFSKCLMLLESHSRGAREDPWNCDWASRNFFIRTMVK